MPIYCYADSRDDQPHVVVAEDCERNGDLVTFLLPSLLDGVELPFVTFGVSVHGDVEIVG